MKKTKKKRKKYEVVDAFIGVKKTGGVYLVVQEGAGSGHYYICDSPVLINSDEVVPVSGYFKLKVKI